MAGRLASHLGASRLSNWLMRCAWKDHPGHAEARYYYAYALWRRRGPYRAWRFANEQIEPPEDTSADVRSSWYGLLAEICSTLRDFDTAEYWLRRAETVAPHSAWVQVCWSTVLEHEDRYEEALTAARRAMELREWSRAGVQSAAHLLTLLNRDSEAIDLLNESMQHLESSAVAGQLYGLQMELQQYKAAEETLERFKELAPLLEKDSFKWFAAQRSELAYFGGDVPAAIEFAKQSDSEFFKAVAANLEDPARADCTKVSLTVPFVRQHHVTCAPATLSALSRYWSMPAEHLQVSDEICYNGTSNYNERKWARENGWVAREFSITEQSAIDLLDRAVPFTFTTVDPGNAHLQAIIGYDARRGTLLVRDPFWRNAGEGLAPKVLARYRAYGPRGMAMVPASLASKLDGLDLPDAELWDLLHELDGALIEHRRQPAQEIYQQLIARAPEHRLTFEARRRLGIYDSNPTEQLAAAEQLLADAPDDQSLQLERLALLRYQVSREERLQIYRELCAKKDCHPIFWQQYAQELRADARQHDDAIWLLRRAIRRWPTEAVNYYILGNIYWDERRFAAAQELYRIAACLGDKDEQLAHSYFSAASWFKQTEQALTFLRDRFRRTGAKSSQPARTLVSALLQLDRTAEALEVLDEAIRLRPSDGQLLLYAADVHRSASSENAPQAQALLEQARGKCAHTDWLRTAARLANSDGRLRESLELWQEVLSSQPLAIDAQRHVTRLLAETAGQAAAMAHLQAAADRFPHHHPLHELWVEWLRDETPQVREPVIRRVIALTPDDAWIRRELAFLLGSQHRYEEAWEVAEIAGRLEPNNPSYQLLRAHLYRAQEQFADAKEALRQAVVLSVDNDYAIAELIDLCETREERHAALKFVQEQLVQQVTFGDGLLAFREQARGWLEADELLASLEAALTARPDLWHAWSAVVQQLLAMNRLDDAWTKTEQAVQRFPLLPRLWLDRSSVCRARMDFDRERESLENALRINPGWSVALRALCEVHERHRDYAKCRELMEQAVARNPLDAANYVSLAENLWRLGEREAALARVQEAVQLEPGYEDAWNCLNAWSEQLNCPEKAVESARELTVRRSGEARSWLVLARMLDAPEELDERLASLQKCLELNPRCVDAYDLRAQAYAKAKRWDEAFAECAPQVFNSHPPSLLQARAAWIEAERGDLPQAIQRMRAVVQEEPHFFGAWSRLADWCQAAQDHPGYLEAAEALVKINPQYEVSLGYLGEARQLNGDRAGAKEAYGRAFELNPTYEFAGNCLFDMQLEDGDLAGAAQSMSVLRSHSDSAFVIARDVQLATNLQQRDEACAALTRLCTTVAENRWPMAIAVQAFQNANWTAVCERVMFDALSLPEVQSEVGRYWAQLAVERGDRGCEAKLQELTAKGEIGELATYVYVEALLKANNSKQLAAFIKRHHAWLRTSTMCWGAVGYALAGLRDHAEGAKWCSNWRDYKDAEPWMLVNVAEALRGVSRDAEAAEVSQHALEIPPSNGLEQHRLWLACDAACAGNFDEAREHLEFVQVDQSDADALFLQTLASALVEAASAPPEQLAKACRVAGRRMKASRNLYRAFSHEPARRRMYRSAIRRLLTLRNTWWAKLVAGVRWLDSFT
ncbi:MAG TPA: C39 family peptidase [Pirellulaceae bacterium]|nr:C39 family peptidase [Pirellulaceae bacterium]